MAEGGPEPLVWGPGLLGNMSLGFVWSTGLRAGQCGQNGEMWLLSLGGGVSALGGDPSLTQDQTKNLASLGHPAWEGCREDLTKP